MLYWGEGVKSGKNTVDFANSDKKMVLIFLKMLRQIFRVKEKRLRVLLYCYSNQSVNKLINYWVRELKIPRNQFIKPYVRQDFNARKINKMPYGVVHIRYNDTKLYRQIIQEVDIMANRLVGN